MNKDALYGNKFVNIRNDRLFLDKLSVLDLLQTVSSPSFVFLTRKLRQNVGLLQETVSSILPNSQGFYSVKSNYLSDVVQTVRDCNFGVQIISLPELRLLKKLDFPADHIIAGGPYLPDEFLKEVVEYGISYLTIYNLDDLSRIVQYLTQPSSTPINLIFQFTQPNFAARQGIRFTNENIEKIVSFFQSNSSLDFYGIASHVGTQLNELQDYVKNISFLNEIASKFEAISNLTPRVFNIGGGFPNADSFPKNRLVQILNGIHNELKTFGRPEISIFYEPGRYIVGDCGFCIATIIRYDAESNTVFLDIGTQFLPKFMKSALRLYAIDKITETPNTPMDFMGPLPSNEDIIVKNYNFSPSIHVGDHVLISNVGAYALTFSSRFPYPLPEIVFLDGDQLKFMKNQENPQDFSLI